MPLTTDLRFTVDELLSQPDKPAWLGELERIVLEAEAAGEVEVDEEVVYERCRGLDQ